MGNLIEGPLEANSRVAIVDDACSTGASLFHALDAAEAEGHEVVVVLAIIDRRQGGSDELATSWLRVSVPVGGDVGGGDSDSAGVGR